MFEIIVVICIVAIVSALIGALIALRIERGAIKSIQAEHEAWEQAQQNSRRGWETNQAKRFAEAETKITRMVQEVRADWEVWKKYDQERIAAVAQQYETLEKQSQLEQELARLPHVEEMPLGEEPGAAHSQRRPATLFGMDLTGRDLSHRYLRSADLREARLVNANLFMADLSGALLAGANLQGADLSGANLARADLREANLADANVQVADLHNALMGGANLIGARHLSKQQLASAHYDETTKLTDDTYLPEPQPPTVRITANLSDPSSTSPVSVESHETGEADKQAIQQPAAEAPLLLSSTDEPAIVAQESAASVEVEAIPETPSTAALADEPVVDEPKVDEQESSASAQSEAIPSDSPALAATAEASFATLLPDLESLLESSTDSQFFSPLAPNDSLLDLQVTDLLLEKQEEAPGAEDDSAASRLKPAKGKRARATNR